MSNQFNSFESPIKKEVVEEIEKLNLSTIQKLHLKLLAHCLEVFRNMSSNVDISFPNESLLKKWCEHEAKKFDDESFSLLLFEQMNSAAEKLKVYSKKVNKNPLNLNIDDLIDLILIEN